jgi:hypothetical protein
MCVLVPQDPERVRWLAQQLAQQKGLQYITEVAPQKRSPYSAISSRKVPCCKDFRHLSSESPILTRPPLEAPFSNLSHTTNPIPRCGSVGSAGPLFQLLSRSPRHPADPQIKAARPIVARFETKAITSPDYPLRPSPSPTCHLFSPWPPCSHHPHFASRTPDLPCASFGIGATLLVSLRISRNITKSALSHATLLLRSRFF